MSLDKDSLLRLTLSLVGQLFFVCGSFSGICGGVSLGHRYSENYKCRAGQRQRRDPLAENEVGGDHGHYGVNVKVVCGAYGAQTAYHHVPCPVAYQRGGDSQIEDVTDDRRACQQLDG